MRIKLLLLLCLASQLCFAQKISYNIPEGYENNITKDDYKKMVDIAVSSLSKRFTILEVNDGAIKTKDQKIFNLHNLIHTCASIKDKAEWERAVKGHFENIFASIDQQAKIDPDKYETIREMLSFRIYPDATVENYGGAANLMYRVDLEGTKTVLMLDLPGSFSPISKEQFAKWKKDSAEVFKITQANTNRKEVDKLTEDFDFDGTKIAFSFIAEENYGSSYALDLATNSPELVGDWGVVVAVPNKSLVLSCKVGKNNPVDFVKFIERTKPFVENKFAEHGQPISTDYFWYYKGKFTRINVTENQGKISVLAPAGMAALMTEK